VAERKVEAPKAPRSSAVGARIEAPKVPSSSAEGARIEAPKAPRGWGWVWGQGVSPSPLGEGLGRGPCPLPRIFFSIWSSTWRVLVHSGWHFEERGKQCYDGSGVLNLANCAILYDCSAHTLHSEFVRNCCRNTATVAFAVKLYLTRPVVHCRYPSTKRFIYLCLKTCKYSVYKAIVIIYTRYTQTNILITLLLKYLSVCIEYVCT